MGSWSEGRLWELGLWSEGGGSWEVGLWSEGRGWDLGLWSEGVGGWEVGSWSEGGRGCELGSWSEEGCELGVWSDGGGGWEEGVGSWAPGLREEVSLWDHLRAQSAILCQGRPREGPGKPNACPRLYKPLTGLEVLITPEL